MSQVPNYMIDASPHIGHFPSLMIFAALVSLAFACLTRRTPLERVKYAAACFALFLLVAIGLAWFFYPLSH
ncbi:MAG: hypothetical protein WA875_06965 [Candidatus Acidiferrales bacterium]